MKVEEFLERLEQYRGEIRRGQPEQYGPVLHKHSKMHALLFLSFLSDKPCFPIGGADHDIIYLDPSPEDVAAKITDWQIKQLASCGVFEQNDSLCMFV